VIRLFLFCRLSRTIRKQRRKHFKAFFDSAVGVLQTLVIALGASFWYLGCNKPAGRLRRNSLPENIF
jgi:hypothetical protein